MPHTQQSPRALVFGGTGQIGSRVIELLQAQGWRIVAITRQRRENTAGVQWLQGHLGGMPDLVDEFDAIFSCGPLDHFAHWYANCGLQAPRVLAFGSTSVQVKQDSSEPAERDVAQRLAHAEASLFACAAERGVAATVLRPTLVYGAGSDKTLTPIAAMAQRTGFFVLPRSATGLRQPVHVQDLANAALAAAQSALTAGKAYAVGGGEVLPYHRMVRRVLDSLEPSPRLWRVPHAAFGAVVALAHRAGRLRSITPAVVQRMREDLVFDLAPARDDFGYAPRAFQLQAKWFDAGLDQ